MSKSARTLLLLAERLESQDALDSVRNLLDRLQQLGLNANLLCISVPDTGVEDDRIIECPRLGHRWQTGLAVRSLRLHERPRRPELLHILDPSMAGVGLWIAEHWRLPYIQTVDEFLGPQDRLRLSRRWCRKLLANSDELAYDLETHYGVPSDWISVAYPGIAVPNPTVSPGGADLLPPVPVIGTAGPLVPSSGFATFLNAARRVLDAGIDAEFVIAGEGEDEVDLRRRADRLRIADRVTFTSQSLEAFRFWSVLDIYCLTSLVPTVGLSLARAMAAGVPSIASEVVGLHGLIEHDVSGLFVPPDNSFALSETILGLLKEPKRLERLGERGRAIVLQKYRPDNEAEQLRRIYLDALAEEVEMASVSRDLIPIR